mgnify:CR=1 FL=1|tara:strand:- start:34911 stop:36878 length:1968 start_codon:yes stop_codon:yes gene_type:complete
MKIFIYTLSIFSIFYFDAFSQNTIKIDGFFDEWSTNINTYIDDSTDSQGIDLLGFNVCNDNEYLYIKIRLADEIDLTEQSFNPAEVMINIDADNNASTGFYTNNIGSEYGINFFDKFIFDDTDPNMVDTLSLYDLDVIPLPTITSDEFEIAINRSLFSDTIAISIREFIGNDFMPDNGSIFTYIFNNCSTPTTATVNFSKNDSSYLRLMTYNVLNNGLINPNRVDKHRRIFSSVNADIITLQECGNTTVNDVLAFLNTIPIYYPYIYTYPSSGNITISKYPSVQSWQVADRIDADLIDLPDSIYSTDILILNGHPKCCLHNEARQENFDALIQFIIDAKTVGGVIDLPINTPISFSGDMNLVGYSEQYFTIINGTISDTITFGNGGYPDWDNTPLKDQVSYFNEKDIAYTWDESNPSAGNFPPGRLDFIFFTNSVMSVDKSFIISTEDLSSLLLAQNNLFWDDTKIASDHLPVVVDFILPMLTYGCTDTTACNYDSLAVIDDGSCCYAPPPISITVSACDSYLWNGTTHVLAGSYNFTTLDNCGCDSTLIMDLWLNYSDSIYIIDTAYNSYTWGSQLITTSGIYTNTFSNSVGCDSIVILNLVIISINNISELGILEHPNWKIINVLGQETPLIKNTPLFYLYENGRVEKRIIIE